MTLMTFNKHSTQENLPMQQTWTDKDGTDRGRERERERLCGCERARQRGGSTQPDFNSSFLRTLRTMMLPVACDFQLTLRRRSLHYSLLFLSRTHSAPLSLSAGRSHQYNCASYRLTPIRSDKRRPQTKLRLVLHSPERGKNRRNGGYARVFLMMS